MRLVVLIIASQCLLARADDNVAPASAAVAAQVVPHVDLAVKPSDASSDAVRFSADSQWEVAGYNSEEIIYIITISSQDSRILRCRTHMQGFYLDQGKQVSITDQQTSTVFPDQQVRVGNWTGLDQKSGATFTVNCRAI